MADLDVMREKLILNASIQPSEKFSDDDLDEVITDALGQHNRDYTIPDLPPEEEEAVVTLAWITICFRRAATAAKESNASGGGGFGQDRSTPYYKHMDLAAKLAERYKMLTANLAISGSSENDIQVSFALRKDDIMDRMVAASQSGTPPVPRNLHVVAEDNPDNFSVVIEWDAHPYANFMEFIVYHMEGDDLIFVPYNFASATGVPKINDAARHLTDVRNMENNQLLITDLNRAVANHFLVVNRSLSFLHSYSNELVVANNLVVNPLPKVPANQPAKPPKRLVPTPTH